MAPAWRITAALGAVYVIWGSTYLAIRVMVETMPALLSSGLRFTLAGTILGGVLAARGGWARIRPTRRELGGAFAVGTLLLLGGNGLVAVGENAGVPSGLAALLIASEPLWVILLRAVTRDRPARGTLVGVAAGFAGVAILLLPGERPGGATLAGVALVLFAALCWATGSFTSTKVRLPSDPLTSVSWQMLLGGGTMLLVGLAAGEATEVRPDAFSASSVAALAYLVVAGSLVAFTAYAWLLRNAPISKVSTYAYVNPVIAVALGAIVLGEEITLPTVIGAAVIVASVAGIMRRETADEPRDAPVAGGREDPAATPAAASGDARS